MEQQNNEKRGLSPDIEQRLSSMSNTLWLMLSGLGRFSRHKGEVFGGVVSWPERMLPLARAQDVSNIQNDMRALWLALQQKLRAEDLRVGTVKFTDQPGFDALETEADIEAAFHRVAARYDEAIGWIKGRCGKIEPGFAFGVDEVKRCLAASSIAPLADVLPGYGEGKIQRAATGAMLRSLLSAALVGGAVFLIRRGAADKAEEGA